MGVIEGARHACIERIIAEAFGWRTFPSGTTATDSLELRSFKGSQCAKSIARTSRSSMTYQVVVAVPA